MMDIEIREASISGRDPVACPEPFAGPMTALVNLSLRYQNRRQPELTVAAALAAMSACMHGRWALTDGLRGNLYIVGLAGTGAGKNGPLNLVKTVLAVAGVEDDVISNVGSGQAVEDQLLNSEDSRAALVVDEVAHLIGVLNKSAQHLSYAEKLILEGYSASSSFIKTRALVKRPSVPIPNPYISLFGTTTFASMGRISPDLIESGLLGRCLVAAGQDFAPLADALHGNLYGDIGHAVGALAQCVARSGGLVPMTQAALELERRAGRELDAVAFKADGIRRTLLMRTIEHAKRVALVLAAWDDVRVVTPKHMNWALRFVVYCQSCLMRFVDSMTDSKVVRDAQRIELLMRDALEGRAPFKYARHSQYNVIAAQQRLVGHSALLKASRLHRGPFEQCMDYLLSIGTIAVEDVKRQGRGGPGYERYYRMIE